MTEPNRHNDHLTADDLQKYRAGALSAAEQHRVERLLLENPVYAEALEGMEALEQDRIDPNRVSNELRERLKNRVDGSKTRRLPFWIPAAAASVVLALSLGGYLWLQDRPKAGQTAVLPAPPMAVLEKATPPADHTRSQPSKPLAEKAIPPKRTVAPPKTAPATDSLRFSQQELIANSSRSEEVHSLNSSPAPAFAPGLARKQTRVRIDSSGHQAISGQVFDEQNLPLPGALVMARQASQKTVTDAQGRFRLLNVRNTDTLQITSVGYARHKLPVGDLRADSIRLSPDVNELAEVVVVGYGTQKKMSLTGSVAPAGKTNVTPPQAPAILQRYLRKNRRIPTEAQEKGISGTVRVRFRVDTDGSVSQLTIVRSLGYGCDEEAIRLIQEGPRWQPARRENQPLVQFVEQDIVF